MKWIGQHIYDLTARFRGDVTIEGDLTVNGTYTQIDTDVTTTEQWLVTNDGTGPAAIINQKGSQDIFDVQDDGTSVFYIEDGGNVGIGTTSPDFKLDVAGHIGMDGKLYHNGDHNTYIGFESDDIKLRTGGVDVITVNSSQNVGIGTTSPTYKLDVKTSTGDDGISLSATSGRKGIEMLLDSGTNGGGDIKMYTGVSVLTNRITAQGSSFINGGNVGIGTTSPTTKLEVDGTALFSGNTYVEGTGNLTIRNTSAAGCGIVFLDTTWQAGIEHSGGNLYFRTGGQTDKMVLKSNGNVGIGTTSPGYKLEVNGTGSFFGNIRSGGGTLWSDSNGGVQLGYSSTDSTGYLTSYYDTTSLVLGSGVSQKTGITINGQSASAGNQIFFRVGNAERMRITSAGRVGIGTTSPSDTLTVNAATSSGIAVNNVAGSLVAKLYHGGVTGSEFGRFYLKSLTTSNEVYFAASGNSYITGGNVGIGTTTPSEKLEVDEGFITATGASTSHGFRLKRDSLNTYSLRHLDGGFTVYNDTDTRKEMSFDGAGNIGIGTTSPASKLHVAGTVQVGVDDTGHDVFFYGATSGKYMKWDESEDNLFFPDNTNILFGSGNDATIGVASDNLVIKNDTADKDVILMSDDGSGGTTAYLTLDGSSKRVTMPDGVRLAIGNGNDLQLYHNGANSFIENNYNGNLNITNYVDDADIIFQSDDGAGGVTPYLTLDGGLGYMSR
jgi:hypothetical protein